MKTKILSLAILSLWSFTMFAQDRTTVTATNSDISDNLDLRAVASIFGDSRNLEDFERRLNDPNSQISNLDLNNDNRVDYLRVIESVEGNAHIIIIQSVLGMDTFQDIATVEVERDRYNRVQVQVVGDVYMYGSNYIYEPVYSYTPTIYATFWIGNYRPYYSSWHWGYYPSFYVAWAPFPVYTYHSHIGIYINHHHHYNYVNVRNCTVAYNHYYYNGRRGNAYERQYPNRSFAQRNTGFNNRHELVNNRRTETSNTRNTRNNSINTNTRSNSGIADSPRPTRTIKGSGEIKGNATTRTQGNNRGSDSPRSVTMQNGRDMSAETPRGNGNVRNNETPKTYGNGANPRTNESPGGVASQGNSRRFESPRNESPRSIQRSEPQRNSSPRDFSQQRGNPSRGGGEANARGGGNRRG